MEFTKIRVRNLPTEEEYIQEKDKEYQVLKKLSKIPLISNGIGALLAFIAISVAIAKLSYFDVGEFMMTMVVGGGMIFLFCKWAFEDVREYKDRKKKYELFQLYLSFDTETETKFVQSDTEVCGKFTGLYFIRMLKEDPHPHVWCNLWSETAAELWFKYKEKIFIVPIAAKGIHDDAITEEECVYDFNPKENGIIYYRQRKPEKSSNSRDEIVIETDDNWGDAKGTEHTCGALCEVRSCEEEYLVCENAKGNGERIVIFNEQKGELYDRINRR